MRHILFIVTLCMVCTGCAARIAAVKPNQPGSYTVMGKTYFPLKEVKKGHFQNGVASWYGPGFDGKKTASGETYDMYQMTAAHNVLPLHTVVKVTNIKNDKEIFVRINDRGPFVDERVIDLSFSAAKELGMVADGTAPVNISVIKPPATILAKKKSNVVPTKTVKAPNPFFSDRFRGLLALRAF